MTYKEAYEALHDIEHKMEALYGTIYANIPCNYEIGNYFTTNMLYYNTHRLYHGTAELQRALYFWFNDEPSDELKSATYEEMHSLEVGEKEIQAIQKYNEDYEIQVKIIKASKFDTTYNIFAHRMIDIHIRKLLKSKYKHCMDTLVTLYSPYDKYIHKYNLEEGHHFRDEYYEDTQILRKIFNYDVFKRDDSITSALCEMLSELMMVELLNYITVEDSLEIANITIFNLTRDNKYRINNPFDLIMRSGRLLIILTNPITDFTNTNMWPMQRNLPEILSKALSTQYISNSVYTKVKLFNLEYYKGRPLEVYAHLEAIKNIADYILDNHLELQE